MLPAGQPSIVDKLESLLDEPVLAMNLGRDNTSTIGLGVADSTLYKGSLVSVPLNISSGQWDVNNITYMVDGQSVSTPYSRATALTNGQYLMLPHEIHTAFYAKIPSHVLLSVYGDDFFFCNDTDKIPPLTLTMVSTTGAPASVTITGEDLIAYVGSDGYCSGMVVDYGVYAACPQYYPMPMIGMPFFFSQYAVLDISAKTIGFAPKSTPQQPAWVYADYESDPFPNITRKH
ncbi:hypothetical protein MMC19_006840 [Ptychographa xylographoides]|nr:hypothetical protein [Ptychographa xylographoides]